MKHQPEAIAWDIETAPQPLSALTDRQRRRLKKEYAALSRREPEKSVTNLVRKARRREQEKAPPTEPNVRSQRTPSPAN